MANILQRPPPPPRRFPPPNNMTVYWVWVAQSERYFWREEEDGVGRMSSQDHQVMRLYRSGMGCVFVRRAHPRMLELEMSKHTAEVVLGCRKLVKNPYRVTYNDEMFVFRVGVENGVPVVNAVSVRLRSRPKSKITRFVTPIKSVRKVRLARAVRDWLRRVA